MKLHSVVIGCFYMILYFDRWSHHLQQDLWGTAMLRGVEGLGLGNCHPPISYPHIWRGRFSMQKMKIVNMHTHTKRILINCITPDTVWPNPTTIKYKVCLSFFQICWQAYDDRRAIVLLLLNHSSQGQHRATIQRYPVHVQVVLIFHYLTHVFVHGLPLTYSNSRNKSENIISFKRFSLNVY